MLQANNILFVGKALKGLLKVLKGMHGMPRNIRLPDNIKNLYYLRRVWPLVYLSQSSSSLWLNQLSGFGSRLPSMVRTLIYFGAFPCALDKCNNLLCTVAIHFDDLKTMCVVVPY